MGPGSDELPHTTTVSTGSSWVFTFGRDCNGELGRLPASGALDATGNPATGHPAAGALDTTTPVPDAIEPETDPVKAQLKGDPRCVTQLSDLPNGIVSVGSGFYHSAAVSSSGELYTWGAGSGGQLGRTRGNSSKSVGVCAAPALVSSLQLKQQHVLRVVGGRNHTVALSAPGRAHTWGRNMHGQLGHPPVAGATRRAEAHVLEPRHLRSLDARGRLAEVSCGEYLTAALTQQGEVLTWGRTANGRSGTGRLATALTEPCAVPRRAFGGVAVSSLALGWCVPLAHWHIDALVHWCIGALVHWCGPLMHWCIATFLQASLPGAHTRGAALLVGQRRGGPAGARGMPRQEHAAADRGSGAREGHAAGGGRRALARRHQGGRSL